jgi:tRNA U34 5-carboxymethylaminomethyl modifying GTPase MnmE/TrmE
MPARARIAEIAAVVALLGAGAAWSGCGSEDAGNAVDKAKQQVGDFLNDADQQTSKLQDELNDAIDSAGNSPAAQQAKDAAQQALDQAQQAVEDAKDSQASEDAQNAAQQALDRAQQAIDDLKGQ